MTPPVAAPIKDTAEKQGEPDVSSIKQGEQAITVTIPLPKKINAVDLLPDLARARYERHHVDLSRGYPEWPPAPSVFLDDGYKVRGEGWEHVDRGLNADPEKKALLGAATEVRDLTKYIGTEIVGLQLADLTNQQRDELALLIAERCVVFFRDQDLSPQKQLELGEYFGKVEVHPKVPNVPGLKGVSVMWPQLAAISSPQSYSFKHPAGASHYHTDLTHELQPAAITHLHNDTIPDVGGDTLWLSAYAAYDKLSRPLQKFLDGKKAVYRSLHGYVDRNDPLSGPKYIEREHFLVRTHPVTGWKTLFVNRGYTTRIVGLEPKESDAILELLFQTFESNLDIQLRFNWKPTKKGLGTSALWDNRISQHYAVWDYADIKEGEVWRGDIKQDALHARHGTRVASLGEKPFFDPNSKSQREALKLANP